MLACESVKDRKTPTAYSGISAWVSPRKITSKSAASPPRITIPLENTSRSPCVANWRGMKRSRARKNDSRGKSANDVLAARSRISIVTAWSS
jgi:hypothetical protein